MEYNTNLFANKKSEDIESIITFDNLNRIVNVYSSRNASIKKLNKSLGEPDSISYIDDKIFDAEWNISFDDRPKIKKLLSINIYYLNK